MQRILILKARRGENFFRVAIHAKIKKQRDNAKNNMPNMFKSMEASIGNEMDSE